MSETSLQRLYEPVVGVHPPGFKEEQSRSGLAGDGTSQGDTVNNGAGH